uniref:Zinc metalloproteinase n=1 Tax=Plectus sambesii TaxID=2011161 RepID=A0A914ULZ2_9BILA
MNFLFVFVFFLIKVWDVTSVPIPLEGATKTSNEVETSGTEETNNAEIRKVILQHTNRLSDSDLVQIRDKLKKLNVNVRRSYDPSIISGVKVPERKNVVYDTEDGFKDVWELNQKLTDYLYQSDILLTPAQMDDILIDNSRQKRKAKASPDFKWSTSKPIPYVFDDYLAPIKKTAIENALKYWQDYTCVSFEYNAAGEDSLKFINGAGCYSNIGRITGQQEVSIGDGCEYLGITSHEVAHALGFYHEQSRYDRDDFLSVNLTNVLPDMARNFDVGSPTDMNFYGIPYEYGSVMSYSSSSFAVDRNVPVIIPLDPLYLQSMGQRTGPTFLDILEMNRHYGCLARCKRSSIKCSRGGYPNPNDCSKCICPAGFGGESCNERQPAQNANCGSELHATDAWQELYGEIGGSKTVFPSVCTWHIIAPIDDRIEMRITELNARCHSGCAHNALQVKTRRNVQPTGYRHCCKQDNRGHVYRTDTNVLPIIAEAFIHMNFTLEYRSIRRLQGR